MLHLLLRRRQSTSRGIDVGFGTVIHFIRVLLVFGTPIIGKILGVTAFNLDTLASFSTNWDHCSGSNKFVSVLSISFMITFSSQFLSCFYLSD